jgi:hypothetical protein
MLFLSICDRRRERGSPSHRARTRLLVAVMRGDANFGGRPLLAQSGRSPIFLSGVG